MSSRLPVQPSRTSASRRRVAKLHLSPPNGFTENTNTPINSSIPIKIKKEAADDEIKEYAATTMSELLGFYGYEKVDSGCTRDLNLEHFVSSASGKHNVPRILTGPFVSKAITSNSPVSTNPSGSPHSRSSRSPSTNVSVISVKENNVPPTSSPPLSLRTGPASPRTRENSDSASDSPDGPTACSYCGRLEATWEPGGACVPHGRKKGFGQFCSETCFAAGRRAAFKRARTCDWCRHIRPSMNKDFQDEENHLQFCSQKCLTQYKMNIFCRETQAHLALHGINNTLSSSNIETSSLITPELWLRDCSSPGCHSEELIVDDETNTRSSIQEDDISIHRDEGDKKKREDSETDRCMQNRNASRLKTIANRSKDEDDDTDVESTEEETIGRIVKISEKEDDSKRQSDHFMDQRTLRESWEILSKIYDNRTKDHMNSLIQDSGSSHESEGYSKENVHIKDTHEFISKETRRGRRNTRHGHGRPKRTAKSPPWITEQPTPPLLPNMHSAPKVLLPQHSPFKFPPHPGMFPVRPPLLGRLPMPPFHHQGLPDSSSSSLLPQVTTFVPYLFPIPIPMPIPVPIPIWEFAKLAKKNKESTTKDEKNSENSIPEDLSKRKSSIPEGKVPTDVPEIIQPASPYTSVSTSSTNNCNETVDTKSKPVCQTTKYTRPLRKRRRMPENSEDVETQLKRRMPV